MTCKIKQKKHDDKEINFNTSQVESWETEGLVNRIDINKDESPTSKDFAKEDISCEVGKVIRVHGRLRDVKRCTILY